MSDLENTLVEDWILRELVAEGVVEKVQQSYIFKGNTKDYLIEVRALPMRKTTRLKENDGKD